MKAHIKMGKNSKQVRTIILTKTNSVVDEQDAGSGIKIWAQIESNRGLQNLECILKIADAVVFSRISLLQDLAPEKLFLAQKIVVSTCNKV
jgi:pyruvate kinase